MATSNEQAPAEVRRISSGRDWSGFLTLANLDAVADRIRSVIGNGRPYTWVACNEGLGDYRPEVRTGQVAEEIRVSRSDHGGGLLGSITVCDSYGVWWLDTEAPDQAAARGREPGVFQPYLTITGTYIRIESRVPADFRLWWVVAVEGGDR